MSKPIQTLLAAYADNLVASASLVEERVPVMDRPARRVGCGTLYFFSFCIPFNALYSVIGESSDLGTILLATHRVFGGIPGAITSPQP